MVKVARLTGGRDVGGQVFNMHADHVFATCQVKVESSQPGLATFYFHLRQLRPASGPWQWTPPQLSSRLLLRHPYELLQLCVFYGATDRHFRHLQSVQKAAARLVTVWHTATRWNHSSADRAPLTAGMMMRRLRASHPGLQVSTRPSADIPL